MILDPLDFELPDPLPLLWWSIDPGDVNVGLTVWSGNSGVSAEHTNPDDLIDRMVKEVQHGLTLVVYETFQLFGWKMAEQQGSNFATPELIGAMKHVCRRARVPMRRYRPVDHKARYKMDRNKPPKRGVRDWMSYGHGGHAKDSENLGEYHIDQVAKGKYGRQHVTRG